jgi:hypothetical protein
MSWRGWNRQRQGMVANMCEGELILCFANENNFNIVRAKNPHMLPTNENVTP